MLVRVFLVVWMLVRMRMWMMLVRMKAWLETKLVLHMSWHHDTVVTMRCILFFLHNGGSAVTLARMRSCRRTRGNGCTVGQRRRKTLFAETGNFEAIRGEAAGRVELLRRLDRWGEEGHHARRMRAKMRLRRVLRLGRRSERGTELLHLWRLEAWTREWCTKAVRMCHLRLDGTPWFHTWMAWMAWIARTG